MFKKLIFIGVMLSSSIGLCSNISEIKDLIDASALYPAQKKEMKSALDQVSQADGFKLDPNFNISFFKAVLDAKDAENKQKMATIFNAKSVGSAYLVWLTDGPKSKNVETYFKILAGYQKTIKKTSYKGNAAMEYSAKMVLEGQGESDESALMIVTDLAQSQALFIDHYEPAGKVQSVK